VRPLIAQSIIHTQTIEQSTDVRNLVENSNFGCGTQVQTDEKELGTQVDTSEIGSQIQREVKDMCCDGSIQTESVGSQMQVQGKEQEVNCQIIRPEEEE
jgi:hypothetical protein